MVSDRTREPRPGENWRCEDWACPSWTHCKHHFGRTYEYAAMVDPDKIKFRLLIPDRFKYRATCDHYKLDRPRQWNHLCDPGDPTKQCPGCSIPECRHRLNTWVPIRPPGLGHPRVVSDAVGPPDKST